MFCSFPISLDCHNHFSSPLLNSVHSIYTASLESHFEQNVHVLWVYSIWCSCIVGVFDMVFMYCGCIKIWCSCSVGVFVMVFMYCGCIRYGVHVLWVY